MKAMIGLGCFNVLFQSDLKWKYIPELIASLPNHGYDPALETVTIELLPVSQVQFSGTNYREITADSLNLSPDISRRYFRHTGKKCDFLIIDSPRIIAERNFEDGKLQLYTDEVSGLALIENILETFLANYLFSLGLLPCHGGVLIKGGSGIALLGASGSGKSTTLIQLLGQSDGVLSNDLFYVDLESKLAYSMDKSIAVRSSSQPAVEMFQKTMREKGTLLCCHEQSYYDAELFFGDRFIRRSGISAFLFCHITCIDAPVLVELDRLAALKHYMQHMIFPSGLAVNKNQFFQIFHRFYKMFPIFELKIPDFNHINPQSNLFDECFLDQVLSHLPS